MPAYAYKININYGYELIKTNNEKIIDSSNLTIKKLQDILGDNKFSINFNDEPFNNNYIIKWVTYKLESMEERQNRIAKYDAYNIEVDKRKK